MCLVNGGIHPDDFKRHTLQEVIWMMDGVQMQRKIDLSNARIISTYVVNGYAKKAHKPHQLFRIEGIDGISELTPDQGRKMLEEAQQWLQQQKG